LYKITDDMFKMDLYWFLIDNLYNPNKPQFIEED
jgi:hypothetical protein